MLRWESLQTKTETEFAFAYILKAAKDAKIERVFTLENLCGPRLSKDGVTYSTLSGKLYILFENHMCLIIYTTTESEIYELLSLLVTIGASLWAWWKNNSFTKPAIEADKYMHHLKNQKEGEEKK